MSWNSRSGVSKYWLQRSLTGTGSWTTVSSNVAGTSSRVSRTVNGLTEAVPLLTREQSLVVEGLEASARKLHFPVLDID